MINKLGLSLLAGVALALSGCATFCMTCDEMRAEFVRLGKPAKAPDSLVRDVVHASEFAQISGQNEHVACWGGRCPTQANDYEVFWVYFAPDPFVDPLHLKSLNGKHSHADGRVISEGVVGRKNFAFDDARLTGNLSALEIVVSKIKACGGCEVEVVGHTDSVGSNAYNDALGLKRASAVKNWLMSRGISSSQVIVSSKGEREPIASNKTRAGRYENRRAAYKVIINVAENKQDE